MNVSSSSNLFFKRLAPIAPVTLLLVLCCGVLASRARAQRPSKPSGQAISPQNAAKPGTPCCEITSIDAATGVVTAKVNSTGKSFQFKVADATLMNSLKVGQRVYANFKTQQVSVDGATPCCNIMSLAKGGVGGGAFQQDLGSAVNPAKPCCAITSIDATGSVTAQDKTTGKAFQFQVNDANLLTSLHVGQSVSANFSTSQVAIAGITPCCQITGAGVTSQAGVTNTPGTSGPQSKPVPADDLPNVRMQIRELKHNANSVTLRFTIFNDGNAPFALGYNFGGWANVQNARLIDSATNKSYTVSILNGCQCSENVHDIAPKSQADLWAKFALPPEVQLVTITIPHFTPMEDIPVGFVGGTGAGPVDGAKPLGLPRGGKLPGSVGAVKGIKTPLTNSPSGSRSGSGSSSSSGNTNAPSVSPGCPQGTPTPGTQDNFAKVLNTALVCFIANCGASGTLNGNTFPAGSSDWVAFTVPDSRANCANPVITVSLSSSGGIVFGVFSDASNDPVIDSYSGSTATGVAGIAGLGTPSSPLQPGTYYIRINGVTPSTVGTWTLKIAS